MAAYSEEHYVDEEEEEEITSIHVHPNRSKEGSTELTIDGPDSNEVEPWYDISSSLTLDDLSDSDKPQKTFTESLIDDLEWHIRAFPQSIDVPAIPCYGKSGVDAWLRKLKDLIQMD